MSIVSAFISSAVYHYSPKQTKEKIQQRRLKKFVKYAKSHSKAIAELYRNVGDDFTLRDLPITSKKMIMENFDDWVTDPAVKASDLKAFVTDTSNVGKRYLNKYLPVTTSGSTGYPLTYLLHPESINLINAESIFSGAISKRPLVVMHPRNRFLIATVTVLENFRRYPFLRKAGIHLVEPFQPTKEIVDLLAKIKPKSLISTASALIVYANEFEKRNIKLNIEDMICGSELLTDKTRAYLKEVLGGNAKNIYGCTEGGNLAFECDKGSLHLHNSWAIIEPVDEDNNPVPFGTTSHKILLTNLTSFAIPIIRYEVTDKITVHDEPCPCGNPNLWIELEGRTASDPLVFRQGDQEILIPPIDLYAITETNLGIRRFQLILHKGNTFECRMVFMPGVDEDAVFKEVAGMLTGFLGMHGIKDVHFYLSDEPPAVNPRTLKFEYVYQVS